MRMGDQSIVWGKPSGFAERGQGSWPIAGRTRRKAEKLRDAGVAVMQPCETLCRWKQDFGKIRVEDRDTGAKGLARRCLAKFVGDFLRLMQLHSRPSFCARWR